MSQYFLMYFVSSGIMRHLVFQCTNFCRDVFLYHSN